ncbi:MAG: (5-formylfuran-3-yl)methyl phosphate synthase [Gammaproteobacteria bacterium]
MSKVLGSIKDLSEAKLLLKTDIDIIDLKDPSKGALGRLSNVDIKNIVKYVNNKKLTSSTVGDLPNNIEVIKKNVDEISSTNINFIKIGVYEKNYIKTLCDIKSCKKLIAVFFADIFLPSHKDIKNLKDSGFYGVMIDTSDKKSGNLLNYISYSEINDFLLTAKNFKLLTGIAGSINETHVDELVKLKPDYMGFRGALCEVRSLRNSSICTKNVNNLINIIKNQ